MREVGTTFSNGDTPRLKLTDINTSERVFLRLPGRKHRKSYNHSNSGVDVSFTGDQVCATIMVLRYLDINSLSVTTWVESFIFPYIPGMLVLREGIIFVSAWEKLADHSDMLMFDGQGIAHFSGFCLAYYIGLTLEKPENGMAKSRQ